MIATEQKHTELRAVHKHGDVYQILDERQRVVGGAYGETLATAFAAAPDLLEALKALYDGRYAGLPGSTPNPALQMARRTIAKATGEQTK